MGGLELTVPLRAASPPSFAAVTTRAWRRRCDRNSLTSPNAYSVRARTGVCYGDPPEPPKRGCRNAIFPTLPGTNLLHAPDLARGLFNFARVRVCVPINFGDVQRMSWSRRHGWGQSDGPGDRRHPGHAYRGGDLCLRGRRQALRQRATHVRDSGGAGGFQGGRIR